MGDTRLPYDVRGLRETILKQREMLAKKEALITEKDRVIQEQNEELARKDHFIRLLQKLVFGKKSERAEVNPNQLSFKEMFEELNQEAQAALKKIGIATEIEAEAEERKIPTERAGHGRKPLAEHLPRKRVDYEIPEQERLCCGVPMKKIREEKTERLDYVPAHFKVIETVRAVYGCEKCRETVIMAPGPNWLVEKGSCSEGVLAHVVVSKYVDHLPLYRLERIFSRQGIEVSPSTLVSWIGHVADHIGPVVRCMGEEVKKAECINTDDTGIPVLFNHGETKKDSAHHGYMWVYRAGNDVAVFKYSADRSGKRPEEYLKDYKGYLQCDAFSGYGRLFQTPHILEVNCWQHAKRKFIEAEQNDRVGSEKAVSLINMLYRVEHIADESGLNEGERLELRREVSAGIVETMKAWLHAEKDRALPKSPIGKAIAYTLNQWKGLTRFLEDGSLQLDNNAAERAMRHVVMGRKNWLFAGSEEGARKMADIYSLLYTCQIQKIDPFVYLKDILTKIANHHPQKEIYDLTPKGWKEKRKLMAEAQKAK